MNPWFWVVFLIGIMAVTFPYVGFDFRFLPGDMGDTRFNIFVLEHAKQYFGREISAYWNAGFMYPEAEVITYSENYLGAAPVFALFRWLGADIFTAFQLWLLAITFLNYWASYKLAEHLLNNKKTAAIAAFVYAFSLSITSQMNHAQTFPRYAMPLSLLFLLLWLKDFKARDFALSVTLLVYQFYCGIYLGFMSAIPFGILFIFGLLTRWQHLLVRLKSMADVPVYAGALMLNLWLMLRLFLPYMRRAGHVGLQAFHDVSHSIPTPSSYLAAHPASIVYAPLHRLVDGYTAFWDHWIFPGGLALAGFITVFIMLTVAVIKPKSKTGALFSPALKWFFLAGFIIFFFYLRIDQHSLYYFLHQLPGFGAMRAMTRIINIELLFIGMALAFAVTAVMNSVSAGVSRKNLVLAGFIALLIVENLSHPTKIVRMEKAGIKERHEVLVGKMGHLPPGSIVSYEPDTMRTNAIFYQLDAMLAAQALHLISVNGYTATSDHMYTPYWFEPSTANRLHWFSRFPGMEDTKVHVIN